MRSVFYVAVAVAALATSSAVAAFTNADDKLLVKTTPNIEADAMISGDSQRRFLRVSGPEDDGLIATDEERRKVRTITKIYAKLDKQKRIRDAQVRKMKAIRARKIINAARKRGRLSNADYDAAIILLGMSK
ncbi:Avirulence protein (Avh) [Phytophthora palmivora]|uniref:RxLR effector protein n=1 Tax=Phytophthora palmivora TaxID=4796 RepID=A0A2P4XJP9_9STRA|nr:Avirulence protein (Avh) [Phytophthora palmivora]